MGSAKSRRRYLDWMRGLAVLVMIEAHVIDSWTRAADRHGWPFGWSLILGGFGAPLFLFLAGLSVALSAGSKARRLQDDRRAAAKVERRGLEIFLLAFLFRIQSWVISRSAVRALLKVDILNIMGPAIAGTAMLWRAGRTLRGRVALFAAATAALVFATPLVRATPLLAPLPDFLEGYLRPVPGLTNFSFFPWAAFLPAGAIIGLFVDRARTRPVESRLNLVLGLTGAAVAIGAYAASYLPTPYARSDFWTSSPAFFFLRAGIMTAAIALIYLWELRPETTGWHPMPLLGRTSLFIYWIHVEMVYGVISLPLHKALTLRQAWAGFAVFSLFMLGCAAGKERFMEWWRRPRQPVALGTGGLGGAERLS
ncbi:MAG TPA: heparan-alpha-glucosaminide N-acetyltransferase domain-containing protein [Vicinamibacterales bacterium]|nr:heparan-alpha-glucosaminide N-acetyltransferase domain-containing protein [Vicinamibacterales bacterium]